ncbi:MAG: hypothetical protein Q8P75_01720 [bacterium]|nr:hypothetical protein [bacterium]
MKRKLKEILGKTGTITYYIMDFLLKAGEVSLDIFIDNVSRPYGGRPRKQSVYNGFARLKKRGYLTSSLSEGRVVYRLAETVRKELAAIQKIKLKNLRAETWDGRWRLVSFDVPEKQKKHRDVLRYRLKRLGLAHFQHSIWLTPYKLGEDFYEIVKECGLKDCVLVIESDKLPQEAKWTEHFNIRPNSHVTRPRIK